MKCVICCGKTISKLVDHMEFGISLGRYQAQVCKKCNETFYDEKTVEKIQQKSKELGLFGLARKVKVAELGNSIAIRIPKELSKFFKLHKGKEVLLIPETQHGLHIEL